VMCIQEGEKVTAQKVYRAALRSRCGTLRVHTAALSICLIKTDCVASQEENLSLAREIHRDVVVCCPSPPPSITAAGSKEYDNDVSVV
jgi:hypothetical protein